jgi:hypothetical protein
MIKAVVLVHLILWAGLLVGGLFRLPAQFEQLIIKRSEVPAHVTD